MLFDRSQIEEALAEMGMSAAEYLEKGKFFLPKHFRPYGQLNWRSFGPYYPIVQKVVYFSCPESHEWNDGQPPPDFLSAYDYGDDGISLCAAMMYLNQEDPLPPPDSPHSIIMPDGSEQLYIPGVGIVE